MKLTGRITEQQERDFVQKKFDQGMTQSAIVREAISIYRRFETGELFVEAFQKLKIPQSIDERLEVEDSLDLGNRIKSGDWGF